MTFVQKPNLSIIVATIGFIISYFTTGTWRAFGETVYTIAIIVWAYQELSTGVNWFRKFLGGVVLIFVAYGLFNRFL